MNFSQFTPRGDSKPVFVLAVACYAATAGAVIRTIATAFGLPPLPLDPLTRHGYTTLRVLSLLLFTPIIESLILIGAVELLSWFRLPVWLQVACSAAVFAAPHALVSLPLAFVVAPGAAMMSAAYVMWRRVSWKTGFVVVASIHALLNLIPAISTIGDTIRRT